MRIKLLTLTSYFLTLFLLPLNQVYAADLDSPPAHVIVVSQVRGPECCDPGNIENLQFQLKTYKKLGIPAYLTLRYDVLTDPSLVKYLKTEVGEGIKLGLFLEITPQLAKDSGVEYTGNEQTWYQAQHAYTIGLLTQDRQKVVDQLFKTFFQEFGYYPELTAAWMTDTPILNYLHDHYGVKVHELTREQWGTDSYTLWGGVEHYPYPASRQWAFIPDFSQSTPLVIIRQTVSDPLLSYADESSSFTSQPNDYIRDGKNFTYFKDLINQTIHQPEGQTGFAVIGLETSMENQHQQEFSRQLEYLSELQKNGQISFTTATELSTETIQQLSLYAGSDLINNNQNISYTINSPNYRIRLRQSINNVFIDDLRIYHPQFTDPYTSYQAFQAGYWVIPDLIDGGRWYNADQKKPILNRLFDPPQLTSSIYQPAQVDTSGEPSQLKLPASAPNAQLQIKVEQDNQQIRAFYQSKDQEEIVLTFKSDQIEITPAATTLELISFKPDMRLNQSKKQIINLADQTEIRWPEEKPLLQMKKSCSEQSCVLSFQSQPELLTETRENYYPFLFPEKKAREVSAKNTLIFAHNHYALANQNPVRLVIAPFDQKNYPTGLENSPLLVTEPAVDRISQPTISSNHVATYFDLHHSQPLQVKVTVDLGNNINKTETVYFAPNCKISKQYCLTHPRQAWWYLRFRMWDWLRTKLETSVKKD